MFDIQSGASSTFLFFVLLCAYTYWSNKEDLTKNILKKETFFTKYFFCFTVKFPMLIFSGKYRLLHWFHSFLKVILRLLKGKIINTGKFGPYIGCKKWVYERQTNSTRWAFFESLRRKTMKNQSAEKNECKMFMHSRHPLVFSTANHTNISECYLANFTKS